MPKNTYCRATRNYCSLLDEVYVDESETIQLPQEGQNTITAHSLGGLE